jgi:hypothetical protein
VLAPGEWDRVLQVAGWVDAIALLATNGPRGRGVTYIRLLGPKLRGLTMARQPCEVFHLDQLSPASPLSGPHGDQNPVPRGLGYPGFSEEPSARIPGHDTYPLIG